jgi:glutathione S-transferase
MESQIKGEPGMKLYYSRGACSLVPHIIIQELNIPCEFIAVDLPSHTLKSDGTDFYKVNPKGAVPVLQLDNGEILTENAVIQQYLADTYKATQLLPALGNMKRYHVLEWLNYISTDLHKGFSPLFNREVPQELKDKIFLPLIFKRFDFINKHLANQAYLTGNDFALPDAYAFVVINWTKNFDVDLNKWPNIAHFQAEMRKRPSVEKALAEEGLK